MHYGIHLLPPAPCINQKKMRLYTTCIHCKAEIRLVVAAKDRFVLARKRGEEIDLTCMSCGIRKHYHVNAIKAEQKKSVLILAAVILLFGTFGLFLYLWPILLRSSVLVSAGLFGLLTVPFLIYKFLNDDERNRVKYFNIKKYG
jgi:hypothetical protein